MKLRNTTKTFRLSKELDVQIISETQRLKLPQSIYIRKAITELMEKTKHAQAYPFLE